MGELDPTERFSDRAVDYARDRPTYPSAAVDAVVEGMGPPSRCRVADVGAGTGISARLLADRGATVVAIEPNRAMREVATPHARVTWRDGTAEATGLPDASVDLVVCAQSFHWFRRDEALAEFRRVLRPGGRVALVWNERDERDGVTVAYGRLVETAAGAEIEAFRRRAASVGFGPPAPGFGPAREVVVEGHVQRLDARGLLGRAMSASYVPKSGPARAALERGLEDLHARESDEEGRVRLVYRTRVFLAETT
jgi:SAM-dependent methyltransferase